MVLSMDRWCDQVAIVTGASSGIGATISARLVKHGMKVAGLARRRDKLEELAVDLCEFSGQFYPIEADVSKEEDILQALEWISENLGPVHVLVNNAGVGITAKLMESHTEDWRKMLEVNVLALCIFTKECVKIMKNNDIDGHIINVNSVLGHYVYNMPGAIVYPGTKHAVTSLTESFRLEFIEMGLKTKITSISPGFVDTEMMDIVRHTDHFKTMLEKKQILSCEDVADAVEYVLSTPPSVQVHELMIRANGEIMGKTNFQ